MIQEPQAPDASLKQLVYVSRATVAPDPDLLQHIIRDSLPRNRGGGITGVLFYFEGRVIQYLEGPAVAVDATMARIRADRRHHDLEMLVEQPATARLFADWHMASAPLTAAGWQRIAAADWPTIAPLRRRGAEGLAVLKALVGEEPAADPVLVAPGKPSGSSPRQILLGVLLLVSTGLALAWPFLP